MSVCGVVAPGWSHMIGWRATWEKAQRDASLMAMKARGSGFPKLDRPLQTRADMIDLKVVAEKPIARRAKRKYPSLGGSMFGHEQRAGVQWLVKKARWTVAPRNALHVAMRNARGNVVKRGEWMEVVAMAFVERWGRKDKDVWEGKEVDDN